MEAQRKPKGSQPMGSKCDKLMAPPSRPARLLLRGPAVQIFAGPQHLLPGDRLQTGGPPPKKKTKKKTKKQGARDFMAVFWNPHKGPVSQNQIPLKWMRGAGCHDNLPV